MNTYKAIFDYNNSGIGTWEDYDINVNIFIDKLIGRKGEEIKKFLEIYQKVYEPKYKEKKIRIRKYNNLLKKVNKK